LQDNTKRDFPGGQFDAFVSIKVFIFCGGDGNREKPLDREKYGVHRRPESNPVSVP